MSPAVLPLVVLLPAFDDWAALAQFLPRLGTALTGETAVGILIVDDGSTGEGPIPPAVGGSVQWIRVLHLRRNLGHQRAIAVGLSYIDEHVPHDAVLVMDADGEDRAEDVPALLARHRESGGKIVFAERRLRAEGVTFRAFYQLYLVLHRALTGFGVRVGNFSVIPRARVSSMVVVSELWIHYAAAVVRSRQPYCLVPTKRGHRLDGRSTMGFVALVVHGLSAISVYSDVVFTRLVMGAAMLAAASGGALLGVVGIRLFTTLAVPGWATFASGLLLLIMLQAVMFVIALTFLILGTRQQSTIVPRRDYALYVRDVSSVSLATSIPR